MGEPEFEPRPFALESLLLTVFLGVNGLALYRPKGKTFSFVGHTVAVATTQLDVQGENSHTYYANKGVPEKPLKKKR